MVTAYYTKVAGAD